jgi:hypothetical protein
MAKLAEIILDDGEVLSPDNFNSQKEFEYKILNNIEFDTLQEFFIKKTLIKGIKNKTDISANNNGLSRIEALNLFKFQEINNYLDELELKKIIKKKQGVNLEMFFFK